MHNEDILYCPYCGEPAESLVRVEDNDADVGYHAIEELCPGCLAAVRIADCADAGLQPWTPLILGWPPDEL